MNTLDFNREKIYERLENVPPPENYHGKIPWIVQQQIGATNGIHFKETIGFLTEYPIPPIPIPAVKNQDLFLDIGCGWGRWLVAASKKNYIPVGIDIRLEFCEVARMVLKENGFNGYTVVADLKKLPFIQNVFDVVWSFSVIQHTHYDRLTSCVEDIYRVLRNEKGYCYLEFPNKNGIRNRFGIVKQAMKTAGDYNSWDVRYYTPGEYKEIFSRYFNNFHYFNHSALGIGVLPGDYKYALGLKNKMGILLSRSLSKIFETVGPLKTFSDSIYIKCYKDGDRIINEDVKKFRDAHQNNAGNNLNIIHLLCCPVTNQKVFLSEDRREVISPKANLAYPIKNGIPIMIADEARGL